MALLPRNNPDKFYDLVVQVAIIRPGSIVGKMLNPYMERRQEITYLPDMVEPDNFKNAFSIVCRVAHIGRSRRQVTSFFPEHRSE